MNTTPAPAFPAIADNGHRPISEMDDHEFVDHLNEIFRGMRLDTDTIHQIACLFEEYCASHDIDSESYILDWDQNGNVSIAPVEDGQSSSKPDQKLDDGMKERLAGISDCEDMLATVFGDSVRTSDEEKIERARRQCTTATRFQKFVSDSNYRPVKFHCCANCSHQSFDPHYGSLDCSYAPPGFCVSPDHVCKHYSKMKGSK